ncbi:MAG TPA: DUF2934 domain-containing protein [Verrucomicrobiae bacterium]|nr:DUF2934 domain-containing protein [Verrucomicrobiae bacterium]
MTIHRPTEEQIRARAYQIHLQRGGEPGHEQDDWLQAEYELIQLPTEEIADLEPPRTEDGRPHTKSVVHVVRAAVVLVGAAF